jgi:tRNA G37 N-methylase Trm5
VPVSQNGVLLSRCGCSSPANVGGFDSHRDSITRERGGWLHIHANVHSAELAEWAESTLQTISEPAVSILESVHID